MKTEIIPIFCANPCCTKWARWTLYVFLDDGTESRAHFCRDHAKRREAEIKAAEAARVMRAGNGVLK